MTRRGRQGKKSNKRTQLKHVARDAALLVQKVLYVSRRDVRDVRRVRSHARVLPTSSKRLPRSGRAIHTTHKAHEVDVRQGRRGRGHQVLVRSSGAVHVSRQLKLLSTNEV